MSGSVSVEQEMGGPNLASLVPFERICEPGAYVCTWDGCLMRVPKDACQGGSPMQCIVGAEPLFVVKISDNPFITISKARMIACNMDVTVGF